MVKMKMFGFVQNSIPAKPKVATQTSGGGGASAGRMNLKNLGSIMKIKSTGCKSCGG